MKYRPSCWGPDVWCHNGLQMVPSSSDGLITHCPLGQVKVILQVYFSNSFLRNDIFSCKTCKIDLCEYHKTSLMRSQHWFRYQWLGAIRQQAIGDPNLYPHIMHMASLGHNVLTSTFNLQSQIPNFVNGLNSMVFNTNFSILNSNLFHRGILQNESTSIYGLPLLP